MQNITEIQAVMMIDKIKSILGEKTVSNFMSLFPRENLFGNPSFKQGVSELHICARESLQKEKELNKIKIKTNLRK